MLKKTTRPLPPLSSPSSSPLGLGWGEREGGREGEGREDEAGGEKKKRAWRQPSLVACPLFLIEILLWLFDEGHLNSTPSQYLVGFKPSHCTGAT